MFKKEVSVISPLLKGPNGTPVEITLFRQSASTAGTVMGLLVLTDVKGLLVIYGVDLLDLCGYLRVGKTIMMAASESMHAQQVRMGLLDVS